MRSLFNCKLSQLRKSDRLVGTLLKLLFIQWFVSRKWISADVSLLHFFKHLNIHFDKSFTNSLYKFEEEEQVKETVSEKDIQPLPEHRSFWRWRSSVRDHSCYKWYRAHPVETTNKVWTIYKVIVTCNAHILPVKISHMTECQACAKRKCNISCYFQLLLMRGEEIHYKSVKEKNNSSHIMWRINSIIP